MLDIARMMQLAGVITESYQIDEAREDFVAQQLGDKLTNAYKQDAGQKPPLDTPLAIAQFISQHTMPAYIQKLAAWYVAGQYKLEDVSRIKADLETFNRVKPQLEKKDLNQYKTLADLYAVLEPFENKDVKSKGEEEREIKQQGVRKLMQTPNLIVLEMLNKEAACFYGKGTKWCTAAEKDNRFDYYHKDGPILVLILPKQNRKFQFHYESSQFMNEKDLPLDKSDIEVLSSVPEYADFLNMMIKKHYPLEQLK